MRDVTERKEAIEAGYAFLTGSNSQKIKKTFEFVDNKLNSNYNFFKGKNPFGEGKSSERIIKILKRELNKS